MAGIPTTTIGAYPKPPYVPISDWFTITDRRYTARYRRELAVAGEGAEELFVQGATEVIADQIGCGIDVVTDGEVRRENYIHYQCRHLNGIDFETMSTKDLRGFLEARLPTITGPVSLADSPLVHDYLAAQAVSARPVKMTVPGPMTIIDSTVDAHYGDERALGSDLAVAINAQIRALAGAGCRHIQIDEPVMARKPELALAHGIDHLAGCFEGVDEAVTRIVHVCCGYPEHLDQEDYPKADRSAYLHLAPALDAAPIDQVSLEDAHRHNDLEALLPLFRRTTVILGVVAVARSRIETVGEIRARLAAALQHLPRHRLVAAPDCGLGHLSRDMAVAKLSAMCEAAATV